MTQSEKITRLNAVIAAQDRLIAAQEDVIRRYKIQQEENARRERRGE